MSKRFRKCGKCKRQLPQGKFNVVNRNAESTYGKHRFCEDCQRATPDRPFRGYANRNIVLRVLGFASYADYLQSDKWQKIRTRVLRRAGYRCEVCGGVATQVHHNLYGRKQLTGRSLKGLKAVCKSCHEKIEFEQGRKVGFVEAGYRFYSQRKG